VAREFVFPFSHKLVMTHANLFVSYSRTYYEGKAIQHDG
jgi:hypothetical protein